MSLALKDFEHNESQIVVKVIKKDEGKIKHSASG